MVNTRQLRTNFTLSGFRGRDDRQALTVTARANLYGDIIRNGLITNTRRFSIQRRQVVQLTSAKFPHNKRHARHATVRTIDRYRGTYKLTTSKERNAERNTTVRFNRLRNDFVTFDAKITRMSFKTFEYADRLSRF